MIRMTRTLLLIALLITGISRKSNAQYFNSGPIPMCDTSYFTTSIFGVGVLVNPSWSWGFFLASVCMNITTDHPQTLHITLTSPMGTVLVLSAYNGAGGVNYTSTCFDYYAGTSITTGTAPFTGTWMPQGGALTAFDGEFGDGTWTITVIDTACQTGGGSGGWTAGWFDGGGSVGLGFGSTGPPPCMGSIPSNITTICPGGSVDMAGYYNSMGAYTYTYTLNGNPVADPSAVTVAGNYQITAYEPWTGCVYWANYEVIVSPASFLGTDINISQCTSSSIDLNANFPVAGMTTQWTFNGTPITNAAASNVSVSGTYEVIATNPTGCNDTAVALVNLMPAVTLGSDQSVSNCTLTAIDLTALYNVSGLTPSWTYNGLPVANPAAVFLNGDYTLIAGNGACADTALVTVSISSPVLLGSDQFVSACTGTMVDLTSLYNTGANSTNWSLSGIAVINPSQVVTAGIYELVATSASGCSDTADVTLNFISSPALGSDQALNICSNDMLDLTLLYNTSGFNSTWTIGGNTVANPFAVNAAGTYTLIASAAGGCADTAYIMLNTLSSPALGSDQNVSFCPNDLVDLTALFNTANLSASWYLSGNAIATPASINTAGIYTLIASSANGCMDTAEVNVIAAADPVPGPDQQITICDGESVDLNTLYVTTGNTVNWTTNGNAVTNINSITTAGIYEITLTNPAGCSAVASVTFTVNVKPALGNDATVNLCSADTADLGSMFSLTGLSAVWTENGNVVYDPSQVTTSGVYQLIAVNTDGCSDTAVVNVNVNTGPDLGADIAITLCDGTTTDLSSFFVTTGLITTYFFNGSPLLNFTAVYDSGVYVVSVSDPNGCTDQANIIIANMECMCLLDFDFTGHCLENPVSFRLIADSAVISAHWTFSDPNIVDHFNFNPVVRFSREDSVLVTLSARLSCGEEMVKKYVKIDDCAAACPVYFPTAFSPNNDVRNDWFRWYSGCEPEEFSLLIYDRFGRMVFKTTNPAVAWDGKTSDGYAPAGLYVYQVEYKMPDQDKKLLMKQLTLLR